jgi:NADH-quinone oxidoreductase subunit M
MVAHGLITGMLFFVAGSVKERYHTLEIKRLSGMLLQMPKLGWILGFCAMASLGLPGLAGFWGEFPAILAHGHPAPSRICPLARSALRCSASLTRSSPHSAPCWPPATCCGCTSAPPSVSPPRVRRRRPRPRLARPRAHGHGDDAHGDDHGSDIHDVNTFEWIAWTPLLIAIVVFGVVPSLMFKVMDPAVQKLTTIFSGK